MTPPPTSSAARSSTPPWVSSTNPSTRGRRSTAATGAYSSPRRRTSSRKRAADNSTPAHLTPSRMPPSVVPRGQSDRHARSEARLRAAAISPPDIPSKNVDAGSTLANPEVVTIKNVRVTVTLHPKTVFYVVTLNNAVARLPIKSDVSVWSTLSENKSPYQVMMSKTREKLMEKKSVLKLDLNVGLGRQLMDDSEWPWTFFWSQAENQLLQQQISSLQKSDSSKKGHVSRKETGNAKEWHRGNAYTELDKDRKAKRRAMNSIVTSLEVSSSKNLTRAESVLSNVISELSEKHGLDEHVVTPNTSSSWSQDIFDAASKGIRFLSKSASKSSLRLLTGIIAILVPVSVLQRLTNAKEKLDRAANVMTKKQFCEMLGINRQAKYLESAFANRLEVNKFMSLSGDIAIGDRIICRGGSGELVDTAENGSVTVKLLPWNTIKIYKSMASAQLRRL